MNIITDHPKSKSLEKYVYNEPSMKEKRKINKKLHHKKVYENVKFTTMACDTDNKNKTLISNSDKQSYNNESASVVVLSLDDVKVETGNYYLDQDPQIEHVTMETYTQDEAIEIMPENSNLGNTTTEHNLTQIPSERDQLSLVAFCENHDDGETMAQVNCNTCGLLCRECDRIFHLNSRFLSHNRVIINPTDVEFDDEEDLTEKESNKEKKENQQDSTLQTIEVDDNVAYIEYVKFDDEQAFEQDFNTDDKSHLVELPRYEGHDWRGWTPQKCKKTNLFKCEHCDYTTSYSSHLKRHITKHTKEKPYTCPYCPMRATRMDNLNIHIQSKHIMTEALQCNMCNYSTRWVAVMRAHVNTHVSTGKLRCPECQYTTLWKSALKTHMDRHRNFRPYQCSQCPYRSLVEGNIKVHYLAKHTKEKPYKCSRCDFRTSWKKYIVTHERKHEKNQNDLSDEDSKGLKIAVS